jgi:prepilin-type N-terminal cleavage/methylation domain-containing protein
MIRFTRLAPTRPAVEGVHAADGGFTLLELIVVLILLAVAAGVVAPSLLSTSSTPKSEVQVLIGSARREAIRRGKTVQLRVDRSGAWHVAGTPAGTVLMAGRLAGPPLVEVDLLISPLGTCGPDLESTAAESPVGVDPLTCDVRPS